jgi:two-component system, LytTR family, sensor kinase
VRQQSGAGDELVITIADNGPGPAGTSAPVSEPGTGVGLENTNARLRQMYGPRYTVTLQHRGEAGGGTVATVVLPYHTAPRGAAI